MGKAINFIRLSCADTQWSLLPGKGGAEAGDAAEPTTATGAAPAWATGATRVSGGSTAATAASGEASALGHLEYGQEAQLREFVSAAAARANSHLLDLLLRRFHLRQHCVNIKRYLLLGKGDFVQYLMEHLAPQVCDPGFNLCRRLLERGCTYLISWPTPSPHAPLSP